MVPYSHAENIADRFVHVLQKQVPKKNLIVISYLTINGEYCLLSLLLGISQFLLL